MTDKLSKNQRSALMARVPGKDTKPEMIVRRLLHGAGYRYRLHVRSMPGTPDLVFRRRKKAIFVHGCFWHGHEGCKRGTIPKTREAFWREKLRRNKERDETAIATLLSDGWDVLVVWECALKRPEKIADVLFGFLDNPQGGGSVTETRP